jgi:formate hydrogenlyase transcriptional activator
MASILIVDDERNIRTHLATFVRRLGHTAETAADAAAALAALDRQHVDLVFSDVRMAGMDGLALLREIRRRRPEVVVVLMTAYATVSQAVEAMRAGAYDYLVKPFSLDQVSLLLERVLEVQRLRLENRTLREAVDEPALLDSKSLAMQRAVATARQAAASDVTVLLTGESGTGKNVLASAIHGWSPRAAEPFIEISCTTLADQLLESELFGHVKGAFTGAWKDKPGRLEAADGGTVFLDEVGDAPPSVQVRLLRVLQERVVERVGGTEPVKVDVRVVAATNRNLEEMVARGTFRADLYYRLAIFPIEVPPLRERREEIRPLALHFLARHAAAMHRRPPRVGEDTWRALEAHDWPGNVRELENFLQRALILSPGPELSLPDLPVRLAQDGALADATASATPGTFEEEVRGLIERALTHAGGRVYGPGGAAALLGLRPTTLQGKMKKYGVAPPRGRP